MTSKIFRAVFFAVAAALAFTFAVTCALMNGYFEKLTEAELSAELELAAAAVEGEGARYLYDFGRSDLAKADCRLTLVAPDGSVIADTSPDSDADNAENHADRAEIKQAFESGYGASSRYSATLLESTIYRAKRLSDGSILRISETRAAVGALALGMIYPMLIVIFAALALSFFIANRIAAKIVEPLNALDLDHPLENNTYEELAPLLSKLNRQHHQINSQLAELKRKNDEFSQITSCMSEGLVLISGDGRIVNLNNAAAALFGADASECVGNDFLTAVRTPEITHAVHNALSGSPETLESEKSGRIFRFVINPIESDGKPIGAVLLCFDITERALAEQNRREFTANVSHELKTPLQSILGSAELIENNLVKPEDLPRFAGHIKVEASRLVSLINDIIGLSRLDEGNEPDAERFSLAALASEIADTLADSAAARKVDLSLELEEFEITAVRRLVYEVIYNLCDNAIKYSKPDGGTVKLSVKKLEAGALIDVADNGIGIPPEHQMRIFERFYRVDKSRSKESGGTGLGLSIVKHAVGYMNGKLKLNSKVDVGTEVKVILPCE